MRLTSSIFFLSLFSHDTATTEIYTLSLHDALPIYRRPRDGAGAHRAGGGPADGRAGADGEFRGASVGRPAVGRSGGRDRKSTRLNSSHTVISYAVFCLKKKKNRKNRNTKRQAHRNT